MVQRMRLVILAVVVSVVTANNCTTESDRPWPLHIAQLGVGTMWYGMPWPRTWAEQWIEPTSSEIAAHLSEAAAWARDKGKRLFVDTSVGYKTSEELLGTALKSLTAGQSELKREDFFIATKWGNEFDPVTGRQKAAFGIDTLDASIKRSVEQLDRIDLLQLDLTVGVTATLMKDILNDKTLAQRLLFHRASCDCGLRYLGVVITDVDVLKESIADDAIVLQHADVVQVPAWITRDHANVVSQLHAAGKKVVLQSPMRFLPDSNMSARVLWSLATSTVAPPDVILTGTRHHLRENLLQFTRPGGAATAFATKVVPANIVPRKTLIRATLGMHIHALPSSLKAIFKHIDENIQLSTSVSTFTETAFRKYVLDTPHRGGSSIIITLGPDPTTKYIETRMEFKIAPPRSVVPETFVPGDKLTLFSNWVPLFEGEIVTLTTAPLLKDPILKGVLSFPAALLPTKPEAVCLLFSTKQGVDANFSSDEAGLSLIPVCSNISIWPDGWKENVEQMEIVDGNDIEIPDAPVANVDSTDAESGAWEEPKLQRLSKSTTKLSWGVSGSCDTDSVTQSKPWDFVGFRAVLSVADLPYPAELGTLVRREEAWKQCAELAVARGHPVVAIAGVECVTARHTCELEGVYFNGQALALSENNNTLEFDDVDFEHACEDDPTKLCGCSNARDHITYSTKSAPETSRCAGSESMTSVFEGNVATDARRLWSVYSRYDDPSAPYTVEALERSKHRLATASEPSNEPFMVPVFLGVISHYRSVSIREAWREHLLPELRRLRIDVVFWVDNNTTEVIDEAQTHGDVIAFDTGPGHSRTILGMALWELRHRQILNHGLTAQSREGLQYEWIVRSDDDTFMCPMQWRAEIDRITARARQPRALPGVHSAPYITASKYIGKVSDVFEIYNRYAAKMTVALMEEVGFHPKTVSEYPDLVDTEEDVDVIEQSRYTMGYLNPWKDDFEPNFGLRLNGFYKPKGELHPYLPGEDITDTSVETYRIITDRQYDGWRAGFIGYDKLPVDLKQCFCKCHLGNHLTFIRDLPKGAVRADSPGGHEYNRKLGANVRLPAHGAVLSVFRIISNLSLTYDGPISIRPHSS